MTSRWSHRLVAALGLALTFGTAVGSSGCLQPREAINRVQPDYLDKTQFIPVQYAALTAGRTPTQLTEAMIRQEPIWAHQVTITDKPVTTGFQGISWYTDMERINWEVTEGFLIARQAFDQINRAQSTTGDGTTSAPDSPISENPRQGEVLAVYAISSHFDIRRSYNAGTGEELNVIEENGSDRPWYMRRFMRVDWSRNLVEGYSAMSYAEWEGTVRAAPVPVQINDPSDPNRPVFDYGRFNGQDNTLRYFDVSLRATFHPEEVNLAQWGYPNIPACVLGNSPTMSCRPADVMMRQSFMRLDPSRDYEPQVLDGRRMARFGFFDTARWGYDTERNDILNTNRVHHSARHNLWYNHHARTADNSISHLPIDSTFSCSADIDCRGMSQSAVCDTTSRTCGERFVRCSVDADCTNAGINFGTHCDTAIGGTRGDRGGLCTLPYRERTVRPIGYHLSEAYPERMMPVTNTMVTQWNRPFSEAVQAARHRECLLDPGVADKSTCEGWYPDRLNPARETVEVPQRGPSFTDANGVVHEDNPRFVWVGCHNPVWGTDQALPGAHSQAEVDATRAAGWDYPDACGPQGTVARLGDIRYSMIGSVNELDQQGPWGLAAVSGDPVTGEVYSGRGAVWQTVTDLQAAFATDMLRVLDQDIPQDQFALGSNVVEAYRMVLGGDLRDARGSQTGANAQNPSERTPMVPRAIHRDIESETELNNILAQTRFDQLGGGRNLNAAAEELANGDVRNAAGAQRVSIQDLARGEDGHLSAHNFNANVSARLNRTNPLTPNSLPEGGTRLSRLRGTDLESRMMNPEEIAGAGVAPELAASDAALEAASPARRNNLAMRAIGQRLRSLHAAHQCNYEAPFADEVVATMLYRIRNNTIPEDVRFGVEWNFDDGRGGINWDEVRRYLTQYIAYGVTLHELGHSIGERHNFSGSADAVNYFDNFWSIRSARHGGNSAMIRPRFTYQASGDGRTAADARNYYSNVEENEGVEEYGYSTVMDYKGWNEDAHGLGRYDHAFVKHGYVDMVEAFDQVANRADALHMFEGIAGNGAQGVEFGLTGTNAAPRLTSFHYTDLPRIVGTVRRTTPNGMSGMLPNLGRENRYDVFLNETTSVGYNAPFNWDPSHTNIANRGPDGEIAAQPHVLVPYRFATDDQAGYYWYDQRYDAGADMYESLRYRAKRYMDYYFANSFARERSNFTINGYRSRMMGRYFDDLYYVSRVSTIIQFFYREVFETTNNYAEWQNLPSGQAQRLAIATTFDTFANALMMPEYSIYGGGHTLRNRPDGSQVYEEAQFGDSINMRLGIGEGRMYQSRYDYDSGMWWSERLINVGSYHDKILSLNYMSETFLFAPDDRDFGQELRNYQVNMYTLYPAQTIRLFGSLLSQDHADVGPLVQSPNTSNQRILRTQLALLNLPPGTGAGQNGRDTNLRAIDPNMGFTTELWTAIISMANFSGTFDNSFINSGRMWASGDATAIEPAAGTTLVTFVDPFSGYTYNALHQGRTVDGVNDPGASARELRRMGMGADANQAERGIAARMLLRANDLKTQWMNETDPSRRAIAQRNLRQYIDLLNVMRSLNRYFGNGTSI